MESEELEGSEKKKVEEAVRLLRSVTGSVTSDQPGPSSDQPGPSKRTGPSDEGNLV
jgi:hypothetical protein